jgi:acetyl-CoA acetyltransferase family protein
VHQKSPDDIVVVSALRTPITRARKGGLKDTPADDLLATLLRASVAATGLNPVDVGDVVVGSVLGNSSQRANECRIGMFLAGFPASVPVRTVNRQCSSGLQAVADVAAAIKAGFYEVGIAAGVETMTSNPMKWEGGMNPRVASSSDAQSCLIPMGVTSENVAERWNISRLTQDSFSVRSHARAAAARSSGRFDSQIVPVHTTWVDPATGETKNIIVKEDDGIREGVSLEALSKLPAVFKKGGSTTYVLHFPNPDTLFAHTRLTLFVYNHSPGNASQISDGAGCVVLARRSYAEREGLPIIGKFLAFAAVGVDPLGTSCLSQIPPPCLPIQD